MKVKVITTNDSPRQIVYSIIRGVNVSTVRALGCFEYIFRVLRDYRLKKSNPTPYFNETLRLNKILLKTHTQEDFFQYGPEKYENLFVNENILVFFSSTAINKLKINSTWAVDGTFKIVPGPISNYIQ
jgi:hypothetical protein